MTQEIRTVPRGWELDQVELWVLEEQGDVGVRLANQARIAQKNVGADVQPVENLDILQIAVGKTLETLGGDHKGLQEQPR